MITTINEFKKYLMNEDILKGGLADKLSLEDIAKMHDVTLDKLKTELELGLKVEAEHTSDKKLAREIALDHLTEMPNYYSKLAKMENE